MIKNIILNQKRSGHFQLGEAVGEWITYNDKGEVSK